MNLFAYDGAWRLDHIVLIGVGGTGSALARLVARMLWQRQAAGQTVPTLILIDPDHVELKNVIRQGFAPADVGAFKSQAIALRYSLTYGLPIQSVTAAFDHEKHLPQGSILIDCTDNHLARREILKGVEAHKGCVISCGNAATFGQVTIGDSGDREQLAEMIASMEAEEAPSRLRGGLFRPCSHLPHFGLLYPELLEPELSQPVVESQLSCGELLALGEQHPLVNEQVALIAAGYLFKLLHRQLITTFATTLDIHNLAVTSQSILPSELRAALLPK